MKYTQLFILLLLFQQYTTIQSKSFTSQIKSWFVTEEANEKIIYKDYQNVSQLDINHKVGNIVIQTWKQNSVALEIVHSGSDDFLQNATMLIQKFDERLSITDTTESKSNDYTDLHIIVPENASITISIEKGDITITESNGLLSLYTDQGDIQVSQGNNSLTAKTTRGNITVSRKEMAENKSTDLSTEKGAIFLYTTPESNLDIEAQTLKGKIVTTIPFTLHSVTLQVNSKTISKLEKKISGFIGKPLSKTKLFCYTGNIQIEPYI